MPTDKAVGALPVTTTPATSDKLVGEFAGATGLATIENILALGGGGGGGGALASLSDVDTTDAFSPNVLGVNPSYPNLNQNDHGALAMTDTPSFAFTNPPSTGTILLLFLSFANESVSVAPTGWTEIYGAAEGGGGNDIAHYAYYKVSAGSADQTVSGLTIAGSADTNRNINYVLQEWAGVEAPTGVSSGGNNSGGTTASIAVPSGSVVVASSSCFNASADTPPTGWEENFQANADTYGQKFPAAVAWNVLPVAGNYDYVFNCPNQGTWGIFYMPALGGGKRFSFVSPEGGTSLPRIVQEAINICASGEITATFPQAAAGSGNTLLAIVGYDIRNGITTPSGWTLLGGIASGTYAGIAVYIKASAGETGITVGPTITASSLSTIYLLEIAGSHELDVVATSDSSGSPSFYSHPSITPATGAMAFSFATWVLGQFTSARMTEGNWVGAVSPTIPLPTNAAGLMLVGGIYRAPAPGGVVVGPQSTAGLAPTYASIAAITFSIV